MNKKNATSHSESQHKSLTHSTDAETIKRSQGNQAKSDAIQEAKRVIAQAKKSSNKK